MSQTIMQAPLRNQPTILVVAYGNPLRRDDGAGLALAARLTRVWQSRGMAVKHVTSHQLVPEMAAEIADAGATHIVFVDTTPADVVGQIQLRTLDATQAAMTLGHQCSPELLMYMAQHLYDVQIPAWLVTIPGVNFGHGSGFSEEVEELLAGSECIAVRSLRELIRQPQVIA